jgi:sodium/hydrogen antiporter
MSAILFLENLVSSVALGGKFAHDHLPAKLRHILAAESAANDGLAYPFLSISIYLTLESSLRVAIGKWFLVGWLCECTPSSCYRLTLLDLPIISSW